ncbi:CaiB/BaiF CoA transferase family protein [Bordetella parapertussis]|uniref:Dehydratase/racemase n=1 Tax=Bordetella parapertussis (strain Bpp5) TaxID=1208660 RepID=K0MPH4_BORPB|nr:CoA transferase [Bordetella parapertussis]CCJ51763.1 putative dehydratase/racemase [Bordetella parapertussis Bpp5]
MNGAMLPLAGIRVIDLSRVLAGPVCGALLGDMGADVIKVEDVEGGDESRHWAPQREGHSPVYVANNRNKRSIAVDLKAPEGRDIVAALIDTADVLIENFGTGAMERLGLGYDTLAARNPRLVYCSIAAFGRQGPRADEAGYEALMQAFSGVMSITGEPGRPPVRCGVSALDIFTGTLAGFAVSNAILMRQTSGVGQRLDASLFDSAVGLLNFQAQNYLLCGQKPAPMGSAHPSLVPYQCFLCHDHRWIFVAAGNDRLWRRLATAIGQPDLADDPRFLRNIDRVAHRRELLKLLDGCFASLPLEDALERCRQAGVPAAPVNSVAQALADPQAAQLAALRPMAHPDLGEIEVVGLPVAFSAIPAMPCAPAPAHGADTQAILRDLGMDGDTYEALRLRRVLKGSPRDGT